MADTQITELLTQLADHCNQVQGVVNTLIVYTDEDLKVFIEGVQGTCVGVGYGGLKARDSARTPGASGLTADATITVFICHPVTVLNQPVPPTYGIGLLDRVRKQLRDTFTVTGHRLKFVAEVPAVQKAGALVWMQVWSVPVQLTQA